MSKGRYTIPIHAICELHKEGLYDLPKVIAWAKQQPNPDDELQLGAEVTRYPHLTSIINGLYLANFSAGAAYQQLVDDCYRMGIDVRVDEYVVEHIVESFYAFMNDLVRRV